MREEIYIPDIYNTLTIGGSRGKSLDFNCLGIGS